jgi:SAM-dependent methyltransferase
MDYTNSYIDEERLRAEVEHGQHRDVIGGLWEELGALQLQFLVAHGLKPSSRLLDLGCGSGRLAVCAVPYLAPDRYFGIDRSPSLIEAARNELRSLNVIDKTSEGSFHVTDNFIPRSDMPKFDFVIAQSLFTHMPLYEFEGALDAIAPWTNDTSRFFATFFIAPPGAASLIHDPGGITTYCDRDPFHFDREQIEAAAQSHKWSPHCIGAWDHPRDQQMYEFTVY